MHQQSQAFLRRIVLVIDMAMITAAFYGTYFFRQHIHKVYHYDWLPSEKVLGNLRGFESYFWLILIILPVWAFFLYAAGAYRELRFKSHATTVWNLFKANIGGLVFFGAFVFLFKLHYVSRTFMILFSLINFIFLMIERAVLIQGWRLMARQAYFRKKILLVGTGKRAQTVIRLIEKQASQWGMEIIGLVDRDPHLVGREVLGYKIFGMLSELPQILRKRIVDEVVFIVPRNWMSQIEEAILYCESVGIRVTLAADLFNIRFARASLSDLEGIPMISFAPTPASQERLAVKRFLDIILSLFGFVIFSPLFIFIALAIKATSPGPIFFRQKRCGLNGRRFTLYKFRSMEAGAHARRASLEHLNEMKGPVFKLAKDPRLTRVGKWLRKTSIDELPQLWNVLTGAMSLIGPRPPLPSEVAKYEPWQRRRFSMRPGITGLWQVAGRNTISDFEVWARLDMEYIDRWSLFRDLQIFLKTIPAVIFGIGAK